MLKARYSDTDLLNIAEVIHNILEKAVAALDRVEDVDMDKYYDKAIAIMRNVAEGRDWTDGVEGYTDLRTPEEL